MSSWKTRHGVDLIYQKLYLRNGKELSDDLTQWYRELFTRASDGELLVDVIRTGREFSTGISTILIKGVSEFSKEERNQFAVSAYRLNVEYASILSRRNGEGQPILPSQTYSIVRQGCILHGTSPLLLEMRILRDLLFGSAEQVVINGNQVNGRH